MCEHEYGLSCVQTAPRTLGVRTACWNAIVRVVSRATNQDIAKVENVIKDTLENIAM